MICEWNLDISALIEDCSLSGRLIHLNKKYYERVKNNERPQWSNEKETHPEFASEEEKK